MRVRVRVSVHIVYLFFIFLFIYLFTSVYYYYEVVFAYLGGLDGKVRGERVFVGGARSQHAQHKHANDEDQCTNHFLFLFLCQQCVRVLCCVALGCVVFFVRCFVVCVCCFFFLCCFVIVLYSRFVLYRIILYCIEKKKQYVKVGV